MSPEIGLISVCCFIEWSHNESLKMVLKYCRKCREGQKVYYGELNEYVMYEKMLEKYSISRPRKKVTEGDLIALYSP